MNIRRRDVLIFIVIALFGIALMLLGILLRGGLSPIILVPMGFVVLIYSIMKVAFMFAPSNTELPPPVPREESRDPKKVSDEIKDDIKATDFIKQW